MTLTIGQTAFNLAMKYTSERTNSGRPLNQLQKVAHRLVDMATVISICKASIYTAARLWDEDRFEESTRLSFMNKAFTTEQMAKVTHDAVVLHGAVGYNPDTTVGVLPWVLTAYPAIIIAVIFMILDEQLLNATVNGVLSIVVMGQNFVKGIVYLAFAAQGALIDPELVAAMALIDGAAYLVGGIILVAVGALNFSQSKLAGTCIWCAAAGFICLFGASYLGVVVFGLVGGIGLLILAIFLVYAGISELIGRTKTQAA